MTIFPLPIGQVKIHFLQARIIPGLWTEQNDLQKRLDFIDLKSQQQKISGRLAENIQRVLAHGQYIMGPEVKELETGWRLMWASSTPSPALPAPMPCSCP